MGAAPTKKPIDNPSRRNYSPLIVRNATGNTRRTRNGIRKTNGGWKFKVAIDDKGWTQAEAARQLTEAGRVLFTPQYVSKLVNNREPPGRVRATVIEQVLGVSVSAW